MGQLASLPDRVLVLAGATASGKSAAAVAVAETLGADVVGADSRQIYRYMEIGTAKPSHAERTRIPHHLIDVADPDERWDAARWCGAAMQALASIEAAGRSAIVCGGTGLYLRSLERGLFRGPAADPALRARLQAEEVATPGCLYARLSLVDPPSAARIHPNDQVRVVRALEVQELTGRPLSAWHADHGLAERPFKTLVVEIERDRDELSERIRRRANDMVEAGLVTETAQLRRRFGVDAAGLDAIGYREAAQVLDGTLAEEELAEAIAAATRAYAKRQRTWLRGQAETVPHPAEDVDGLIALAARFFS